MRNPNSFTLEHSAPAASGSPLLLSHQLNLLGAVVRLHHGQDDAVGALPGDPHGGRIIGHDVLEHAQAGLAHVGAVQVCEHCGQQSRYAALPDEERDMRRMAGEGDEHLPTGRDGTRRMRRARGAVPLGREGGQWLRRSQHREAVTPLAHHTLRVLAPPAPAAPA